MSDGSTDGRKTGDGADGPTLQDLQRNAVAKLAAAGVPDPLRDVRRLLAFALETDAAGLIAAGVHPVSATAAKRFQEAITARAARHPISHITGARPFWGRSFTVTPDVLDPRPETESLIAEALTRPFDRCLDLGTGSGCLLLTLLAERPEATGLGTDISDPALSVARVNAEALRLGARAELRQSDWLASVTPSDGPFDLIVSNPPYIAAAEMADLAPEVRLHEPALALSPGGDGLAAYRTIAATAGQHAAPGGRLLLEIGHRQAADVCGILAATDWSGIAVRQDLDGRDRVIVAQR